MKIQVQRLSILILKEMSEKKEFLTAKRNLTGITKFMNETFKKQNGNPFTTGDVQKYIQRRRIPGYLGGNIIEICDSEDVKLYNIVK